MACLVVAAWTCAAALAALEQLPGWALICAAMTGAALGIQLMILVYEFEPPMEEPTARAPGVRHLEVVRRQPTPDRAALPQRRRAKHPPEPAQPAMPTPA